MIKDLKNYEKLYSIRHDGKITTKSDKETVSRSQSFSKGMMRTFYHAVILEDSDGVKKVHRINDLLLETFDRRDIIFVWNWDLSYAF